MRRLARISNDSVFCDQYNKYWGGVPLWVQYKEEPPWEWFCEDADDGRGLYYNTKDLIFLDFKLYYEICCSKI